MEYSNLFDKIYLIDEINLNLMGYYAQNENSKAQFAPIRGGCLPEINNKLKIIKISDNDNIKNELFHNIIINSENCSEEFTYNNNHYLGVNLNIENGYLGSDFCRNILNINGLIENYNVESIIMKRTEFLKDNQKTRGMYKILYNNNNNFNKNEIFEKNIYGENAALYSVLYNDNNSVEKIISLGEKNSFEIENDDELNSFLISCMTKKRLISNILVDQMSNHIINSSNETKITALHYACLYNYSELANKLMIRGANIFSKTRNHQESPLDYLLMNGNYETLELLLKYPNVKKLVNEIKYNNSTSLHISCSESLICTKLLITNINNIKKTRDFNLNTPEHIAFFSGRIDIYNYISKTDIKEFTEYINNLRNDEKENINEVKLKKCVCLNVFLDVLNNNLKKGNIKNIIKLMKYFEKNNNLKHEFKISSNKLQISDNIINNCCIGRNPEFLKYILDLVCTESTPISGYIGKYGCITFIEELKNLNINMFSKLEGKSLIDYAIENNNKDIIIEFFNQLDSISDDILSEYITNIISKSFKLYDSIMSFILSKEKFKKNKLNFNYLYSKDSLPIYFEIFLQNELINKDSLDLIKVKENCRDSVIDFF